MRVAKGWVEFVKALKIRVRFNFARMEVVIAAHNLFRQFTGYEVYPQVSNFVICAYQCALCSKINMVEI